MTFLRDLLLFLDAVAKEMKWFLGTLGITLIRFWKPIVGRDLPNWVFWAANGLALFFAFFLAWRKEHLATIDATASHLTDEEKDLLVRTHKVHAGLLELMRRFPSSQAVLSPFSIRWRPSVGTTNIPADIQQTMDWHKDAIRLVLDVGTYVRIFPELTTATPFANIQALECLITFEEIEAALMQKAVKA